LVLAFASVACSKADDAGGEMAAMNGTMMANMTMNGTMASNATEMANDTIIPEKRGGSGCYDIAVHVCDCDSGLTKEACESKGGIFTDRCGCGPAADGARPLRRGDAGKDTQNRKLLQEDPAAEPEAPAEPEVPAEDAGGDPADETTEFEIPEPSEETAKLLSEPFNITLPEGETVLTSRGEMSFQNGFMDGFETGYRLGFPDGQAGADPRFTLEPPPEDYEEMEEEGGEEEAAPAEGEEEAPAEAVEGGGRRKVLQEDFVEPQVLTEFPALSDEDEKVLLAPLDLLLPNGTVIPTNYIELAFNDGRQQGIVQGYATGYNDGSSGAEPAFPMGPEMEAPEPQPAAGEGEAEEAPEEGGE